MDVDGAAEQRSLRVRDLWRNGTGWAFDRILPYVPQNTRLELSAIVLDNVTGAKDRLAWGETANGAFTVKSAYSLLTTYSGPKPNMSSFYDRIWKVIVPERVRMFLWLVGRQVIMTNVERERDDIWGIQESARFAEEAMKRLFMYYAIALRLQGYGEG